MKRKVIGYFAMLGSFILTAGCATTTGETAASPILKRDTTQMVILVDSITDQECSSRKIVNTEIIQMYSSGKSGIERWTVDRCGKLINYRITFTPSPRGGTDFTVKLEK